MLLQAKVSGHPFWLIVYAQVSWTDLERVCFGNAWWSGSIYPNPLDNTMRVFT